MLIGRVAILTALMNLLLAVHWSRATTRRLAMLEGAGSVLLMASPLVFTAAFVLEPALAALSRPYALTGLILAVLGTILHVVSQHFRT
jgi:hypothetical protein